VGGREVCFSTGNPGIIGWGPLDYYFSENDAAGSKTIVIAESLIEDIEVVAAAESAADASSKDAEALEATTTPEENIKFFFAEVEAKKASLLRGLAKLSAQLYDIAMAQLKNDSTLSLVQVRGILSTGRM